MENDAQCHDEMEPSITTEHFNFRKEPQVKSVNLEPYTIEKLHSVYALSLHKAAEILERFGGDKTAIDKMMKRCPLRDDGKDR